MTIKLALVQWTVLHEMVKSKNPDISLMLYKTDLKAIEAVSSKETDAYISNMLMASFLFLNKGLYNMKVATPSPFGDHNLFIGTRNDWLELASIIDKGVSTITSEEQEKIRNSYFPGQYEQAVTAFKALADIIKEDKNDTLGKYFRASL